MGTQPSVAAEQPLEGRRPEAPEPADSGLSVVEGNFERRFFMEKRYYIAYGSNLNVHQMRMRCPSARRIGTSELKGYELLFKGSKTGSYLTVEMCIRDRDRTGSRQSREKYGRYRAQVRQPRF